MGAVQPPESGFTRERLVTITLLIATGVIVIACAALLTPFVTALTWAFAIAIIAYPVHAWLQARIQNPEVAAVLAVVLIAAGLVGPSVFIAIEIARQLGQGAEEVQKLIESGAWRDALQQHPSVASLVARLQGQFDPGSALTEIAGVVRNRATQFLKGTVWSLIQLAIALYALFFFFRDRARVLAALRSFLPLSPGETDEVFGRVRVMVRATIYGNVMTSLLQGALGGMMFAFLGLPAPLLWGVAMFAFSLIPSLGTFIVWAPTAAFLAATGSWGKALILTAWGLAVVSSIDNFIYPFLVGRDIRMHTLLIFLGLVGGVFLFGAAGLVLGPVILAIGFALLDILRRRTAKGRSAQMPT